MLAARIRSGLVETFHDGAVAVVDAEGSLIAFSGDIDRPFFLRSAAKPFQAHVSLEFGAPLAPVEIATGAASHHGLPVQIALVRQILAGAGLDEPHLQCPESWPASAGERHRLAVAGHQTPRRIWHNCSGKHAAWLSACVASGSDTATYLSPEHPVQRRVIDFVTELGEHSVLPVGVDGCGAPVLRTTTRAMALMFARLSAEPSLTRVRQVIHRYPALTSGPGRADAAVATALDAAAKGGAEGCLGISLASGVGLAIKSWDGIGQIAEVAGVAALDQLGVLTPAAERHLASFIDPPVLGGGRPVGHFESHLDLRMA